MSFPADWKDWRPLQDSTQDKPDDLQMAYGHIDVAVGKARPCPGIEQTKEL